MNAAAANGQLWMPLLQYGAIGAILAIFLLLFVWIFKRLIDGMLTQNKSLSDVQTKMLSALQAMEISNSHIERGISGVLIAIRQLDIDLSTAFNSSDLTVPNRRQSNAPRTRTMTQPEIPSAKRDPKT